MVRRSLPVSATDACDSASSITQHALTQAAGSRAEVMINSGNNFVFKPQIKLKQASF